MAESQKVEISLSSYLKLLLVVLGVFFLWQIRDVVIILFIVFVLVKALEPIIKWMMSRGIPRVPSLVLIYVLLVGGLIAALSMVIPPLVSQLQLLAANVPLLIAKVRPMYNSIPTSIDLQQFIVTLTNQLGTLTGDVVTVATRLFGGIVSLLTVFVLSFYMLLDEKQIDSLINLVVPSSITGEVRTVLEKIGVRVGGWVRGQVIISAIMGITTFVALSLVGLPYALTIGVAAAVFEVLPIIGPIVTAIVAVVIALGSGSWGMAIGTLVVFTILQQLEGHFIVPKVMQKAVGLSPVVIIVALLIGSVLAGVPGAILAVPAAACIDVFVDEWSHLRLAFERGRV